MQGVFVNNQIGSCFVNTFVKNRFFMKERGKIGIFLT